VLSFARFRHTPYNQLERAPDIGDLPHEIDPRPDHDLLG